MNNRISVHLCTKDRFTEVALCLQSLRTQTFKDWDVVIIDDSQQTILNWMPYVYLASRLKLEGHQIIYYKMDFPTGVCSVRNKAIELDTFNNEYVLRVDDDVILEPDYIERLIRVLKSGYDIASGVTPRLSDPDFIRETKFLNGKINGITIVNGDITYYGDDCGYCYTEDVILPADHFRSCCLYKKKITDEGVRYPLNLSFVGFREETFFSMKATRKGYKIGVDTGATVYHFQTPSGGCRTQNYGSDVAQDEKTFRNWVKETYTQ